MIRVAAWGIVALMADQDARIPDDFRRIFWVLYNPRKPMRQNVFAKMPRAAIAIWQTVFVPFPAAGSFVKCRISKKFSIH